MTSQIQVLERLRSFSFRSLYVGLISLLSVALLVWSGAHLVNIDYGLNLALLFLLAATTEVVATTVQVGENKMAYEVGTAVSMAAIPLFGTQAAVVTVALVGVSFWVFNTWRIPLRGKPWEQLLFNVGMHTIAIFLAGLTFGILPTALLVIEGFEADFITWLAAVIVYDQVNFWLLAIMLLLVRKGDFKPWSFWAQNRWAMFINILVLMIGGSLLAFAVRQFDWIGIVIFFLPIALSSIAFQTYVNQMKGHMDDLESIIAERTQELSALMKEKDAFLAVLTHDMKTPLTSINLYGTLLKNYPDAIHSKPYIVDNILHSYKTLHEMVDNILDLEKLQTGDTVSMELGQLDLVPVLEYVVESLKLQSEEKGILLQVDTGSVPIIMEADRQQVERVLQNLISNAIKYTAPKGQIIVRATVNNDSAAIDVQDSGYGIPEEELPFIFDRFRRVSKHKNKAVGTGLGLAISKALVEAHGGTISVTSREGVGSTFSISLPIYSEA